MSNSLTLKWGTVKGWDFESTDCKAFELLKGYLENSPISCAMDRPDEDRKRILCEIIDEIDGEIYNDWECKTMTKEEAKDYVMGYDHD